MGARRCCPGPDGWRLGLVSENLHRRARPASRCRMRRKCPEGYGDPRTTGLALGARRGQSPWNRGQGTVSCSGAMSTQAMIPSSREMCRSRTLPKTPGEVLQILCREIKGGPGASVLPRNRRPRQERIRQRLRPLRSQGKGGGRGDTGVRPGRRGAGHRGESDHGTRSASSPERFRLSTHSACIRVGRVQGIGRLSR